MEKQSKSSFKTILLLWGVGCLVFIATAVTISQVRSHSASRAAVAPQAQMPPVTPDLVMNHIAIGNCGSTAGYENYSEKLAQTFSQLTDHQRSEVLNGSTGLSR